MDKAIMAILVIMITCASMLALGCTGASESGTSQATATAGDNSSFVPPGWNDTHMQNGTRPDFNGTYNDTHMRDRNGTWPENGTWPNNGTMPGRNGTGMPDFNRSMMNQTMMGPSVPVNAGQS